MAHLRQTTGGLFGSKAFTPWQMWLDEMMDKYDERSPSRGLMFLRIINEFTAQKAKAKGFTFSIDPASLRSKIATWAYVIDREFTYSTTPKLHIPAPTHNGQQKHWELFEKTFSDDYWTYVRSRLVHTDDMFNCELATEYFWANLTYFMYRFISLEHSVAIQMMNEEDRAIDEEERAFLISEGLIIDESRTRTRPDVRPSDVARRQDDEYYRDAGFYRGDRRYY